MDRPTLILASNSRRRQDLFEQVGLERGIDYHIVVANVDETLDQRRRPYNMAMALAKMKAQYVAAAIADSAKVIVIGGDTIVVADDMMLGKPENDEEAKQMLRKLSGRQHDVYTGLALHDKRTGKTIVDYSHTEVTFNRMTEQDIAWYVGTGEPMGKAGAYAIQGKGGMFIKRIDGCMYNVIGLPLPLLRSGLHTLGFSLTNGRSK